MDNAFAFLCSAPAACPINWVPKAIPQIGFFVENCGDGFAKSRRFGLSAQPVSRRTARALFSAPQGETQL
jgi:hypothetical protein